jgi:putative MATE family efflux protein
MVSIGIDRKLAGRILSLAVPVVVAMLTQTALNLVDTAMVGFLPSGILESRSVATNGQTALAISLPLLWSVGGFLSAIAVGTQAITARRFGEAKFLDSGATLTNSLVISSSSGAAASLAAYVGTAYMFPFFNDNPHVLQLGIPYCQWRMVGVFSMVTTVSYKSFFDGLGKTKVHMYAALVMNFTNIVLNYGLIFGKFGLPRMEVEGAGLASAISSYLGLGLMVAWSFRWSFLKKYRYYKLRRVNRKVVWEIIRLSVPSGLATVFVMSGFLLFLKIVSHMDALAGTTDTIYTTATKGIMDIVPICFMSSLGYGTATATLVGQSMGAKNMDLAERYGWTSVKLGAYFMAILALAIFIWPDLFLKAFGPDPRIIETAIPPLRLIALTMPLITAAFVFTQALFGAGNTRFVMMVEGGLHFGCLVPLAYIFGVLLEWGIMGVWVAAITYVVALCIIMGWKFWQGTWKEIRI